ncbi:MAG: DNA cytosine methyltransferase [Mycoplasmataceae bacterium]|nr:DNA cytosine methyltransferase [Mycoplasmataceae bacterium]
MKNKKEIKFIEFFAGAGGMSLGLKMAGWTPLAAVEIMPTASETYEKNIPYKTKTHLMINGDITDPEIHQKLDDFVSKNSFDVLVGGFPCQGFSLAGLRDKNDDRNQLYKELFNFAKKHQPKYLLMENVKGILSMLNGEVIKKIVSDFESIGYNIEYKNLVSSDYGVPQRRERVIFIGNNINKKISFPVKMNKKTKTVRDAISDLIDMEQRPEFNHEFTKHSDEMVERLRKIQPGKSLYENYSDAWRRVFWDKPSPTVKENHGATFVHPSLPRVMTARELARLQSFPDDFIFSGAKKWQLVQLGNAVPPLMAKAIAKQITKDWGIYE